MLRVASFCCLAVAVAALAGSLAAGCTQEGAAAAPVPLEAGGDATVADGDAEADDGGDGAAYAFCPDSIDASFGSLTTNLFATSQGCVSICHIAMGASSNGDLAFDDAASVIYSELLGPDGGGQRSSNQDGTAEPKPLRVARFDPDASLLYIKLNLHTFDDPLYGSGMPGNTPGALCPSAIDAVREWILQGAPFSGVPGQPSPDAGDAGSAND